MSRVDRSRLPVPGPPRPFAFPQIARARLDNGVDLRVVSHRSVPVAATVLLVPGGSSADAPDQAGLASLTVAPRGQSKWDGVRAFCRVRGIDEDRVLAVADGPNDLELLDMAAVAAVPAVAHPAALERADHVLPAAADGGWADVLALI